MTGEVPSSLAPPAGCRFHTRCPMAQERCRVEEPKLESVGDSHQVACHFAKEAVETNPFGSAVSSFVVEQLMSLRHPEPSINMASTPAPALAGAVSADDKSATAATHLLNRAKAQTDGAN